MTLDPDTCYRAFASRDRRFEGRFVTAVVTTHIYCRPGCPARLPRRRNIRFYACPAAAEAAGFRPCLRCRPDAVPGSPAWTGTSATVNRALRLIDEGALDGAGVDALAARLGVTDRHVRRLFDEHLGASPLAVARTRRVHFARRLIEESDLPLGEIAFAAGFTNVRRFNAAMRETFRRPPRDLRRRHRAGHAQAAGRDDDGAALALTLRAREPFDGSALLAFFAERAIPGMECVEQGVYRRTIDVDGALGTLAATPLGDRVEVAVRLPAPRDLIRVAARIGRMFDLDADTSHILAHLRRDPVLARALAGRRDVRVPGAWQPFELAVRAILGQQISVRGASTLAGRLLRAFGRPVPDAGHSLTHVFPTPDRLAREPLDGLGLTRARAAALRAFAAAVAERRLDFERLGGLDDAVRALCALPGIGEWTAHYIAMRALGEPDAFPAGDLGVRRSLAARANRSPKDIEARASAWRPWRAYAVMALWTQPRPQPRSKP